MSHYSRFQFIIPHIPEIKKNLSITTVYTFRKVYDTISTQEDTHMADENKFEEIQGEEMTVTLELDDGDVDCEED